MLLHSLKSCGSVPLAPTGLLVAWSLTQRKKTRVSLRQRDVVSGHVASAIGGPSLLPPSLHVPELPGAKGIEQGWSSLVKKECVLRPWVNFGDFTFLRSYEQS